jgi:hypothetical protein
MRGFGIKCSTTGLGVLSKEPMLAFLLLLAMAGAAWAQAPPPEQTYAVIIGVEKYQQTRNEITCAETDTAAHCGSHRCRPAPPGSQGLAMLPLRT